MGFNYGNHGPRVCVWRAWCAACKRHLALQGRQTLWPDEIKCAVCGRWAKTLARGKHHLAGDVLCPHGSGRNRVSE